MSVLWFLAMHGVGLCDPPPTIEATAPARAATVGDLAWVRNFGGTWYVRLAETAPAPQRWEVLPQDATTTRWVFRAHSTPTPARGAPPSPVDAQWASGDVRCTAGAVEAIAEEYALEDDDPTSPRCASEPGLWARLTCDGEPSEVALHQGVRPPEDLHEVADDDVAGRARSMQLGRGSDAVAASLKEAAGYRGEAHVEVAEVRRFVAAQRRFDMVVVVITTGEADWGCGGEDYQSTVTVCVDADSGDIVWARRADFETEGLLDLHDVERDGIPEAHYGSFGDRHSGTWRSGDGTALIGHEVPNCICGC
jgi:hypothetical protein